MLSFALHLTPSPAGYGKPVIAAERAGLCGVYVAGLPWAPSLDATRAALPYRFRKAFDRSGGRFWFSDDTAAAQLNLTDYRGRPLVTLYAFPVGAWRVVSRWGLLPKAETAPGLVAYPTRNRALAAATDTAAALGVPAWAEFVPA